MPVSRRNFLKLSAATLGGLALSPLGQASAASDPPKYIKFGDREVPQVALTFDDCYHITDLQKLEGMLESYPQIQVTFFAVGQALLVTATQDPEIWQRLTAKGHEVGYHSFNHDNLWTMNNQAVLDDFNRWYDALGKVLAREPEVHFARPPYGNRSRSFENMCKVRNLTVAMWSASWGGPLDKAELAMKKVFNGDVILMHIDYQDMINAASALPFLVNSGLPSVTMSQLASGELRQPDPPAQPQKPASHPFGPLPCSPFGAKTPVCTR